jgi:hypothetical protein
VQTARAGLSALVDLYAVLPKLLILKGLFLEAFDPVRMRPTGPSAGSRAKIQEKLTQLAWQNPRLTEFNEAVAVEDMKACGLDVPDDFTDSLSANVDKSHSQLAAEMTATVGERRGLDLAMDEPADWGY